MWYDANANGVRDSNVVRGEFNDVEYKFGVGGVQMMLRECDWSLKGDGFVTLVGLVEVLGSYAHSRIHANSRTQSR